MRSMYVRVSSAFAYESYTIRMEVPRHMYTQQYHQTGCIADQYSVLGTLVTTVGRISTLLTLAPPPSSRRFLTEPVTSHHVTRQG